VPQAAHVNSKSAETVTKATIKLLKPYKDSVPSVTADNCKEFAYYEEISNALSTDFYFPILIALGSEL
jgi:IS30 family transposase